MKIARNIIMAAAVIIAAASCTKESGSEYLNLSVNGYTFGWDGNDTLRVIVSTSESEWTAEPDNNAIKAERNGDEAVLTMQPNETSEYVSGVVTFTAGGMVKELYVDQSPKSYDGMFRDFPLGGTVAMSPNGKYIAYMTQTIVEGDTYKFEPWLLNTETGELKLLEEPPYVGMGMTNYDGFRCLSDDARYIVFENAGEAVNAMTIDGEVYDIKVPEGYSDNAKIEYMSGDGRVWVGFVKMDNVPGYYPCRWVDGEPEILERPQYMIDGVTPTFAGTMARGCSYDGSVIYGSEWDSMLLVYWKDGQLFNIGQEQGEIISNDGLIQASGLKTESQNTSMSPDGRYIGVKYGPGNGDAVPALVDTQTGRYETLDMNGTVMTIGPDGTVFGASPAMMVSQGWIMDFENGTTVSLEDWLQQEYGITISGGRMVTHVSTDGKVLLGYRIEVGAMGASYPYWFIRLEK